MDSMVDTAPLDIQSLGQRIRYAREAAGLTQEAVAAHFGIRRVSVTQWENDVTRPALDKIEGLAELLNTRTDWLLRREGHPPLSAPKPKRRIIPGDELVGGKDLPIYAAAMGGEGHVIITFDPVDYVKRPAVLQSVRGGYGIIVKGTSMVPAYWEGDIALVNPHLPPARDTDCVFTTRLLQTWEVRKP